jgi:hypothetical protein
MTVAQVHVTKTSPWFSVHVHPAKLRFAHVMPSPSTWHWNVGADASAAVLSKQPPAPVAQVLSPHPYVGPVYFAVQRPSTQNAATGPGWLRVPSYVTPSSTEILVEEHPHCWFGVSVRRTAFRR